jgi:hypothetical protein
MQARVQDILVILDESFSMRSMGTEPIDVINSFIEEQRVAKDGASFSLWKFKSQSYCVIDDILLDNVGVIEDYHPSDKTALYDTICRAIKNKRGKDKFKDVICLIMTDGEDNCSKKHTHQDTNELVDEMTNEHGWTFIYLGKNHDAKQVGSTIGFNHCANFENRSGSLTSIVRQTSSSIIKLREASSQGLDAYFTLSSLPIIGACFKQSVSGLSRQPSSWSVGNQ